MGLGEFVAIKKCQSWVQWHAPVVPATWEAETGRSLEASLGNVTRPCLSKKKWSTRKEMMNVELGAWLGEKNSPETSGLDLSYCWVAFSSVSHQAFSLPPYPVYQSYCRFFHPTSRLCKAPQPCVGQRGPLALTVGGWETGRLATPQERTLGVSELVGQNAKFETVQQNLRTFCKGKWIC